MSWGVATQNGVSVSLASIVSLSCGATEFSPASLFTSGVAGAWYDPSDYSTLFQNSAGTTPVTAVEQPVGLMLDKSQGLVLGSDVLFGAGDFSSSTGWTLGTGWTISSGSLNWGGGADATAYYQTTPNMAVGLYLIQFTVSGWTSGSIQVRGINNGAITEFSFARNGVVFGYALASGAASYAQIRSSGLNAGVSIDNLTVRLISGNHASQATPTSCPVLRARYNLLTYSEQFNNVAWLNANSGLVITANDTTAPDGTVTADKLQPNTDSRIYQNITSAGTNTISVYAKPNGLSWINIRMRDSGLTDRWAWFNISNGTLGTVDTGLTASITAANNGFYRCVASISSVSTSSAPYMIGVVNANNAISYAPGSDMGSVWVWGADLRTGSSAGTYQRIAAATDYATAGFLPYLYFVTDDSFGTNSIDFSATDKMSVCAGVTKLTDASTGVLVELSAIVNNAGSFAIYAPNIGANYQALLNGSALAGRSATTYTAPITNVLYVGYDISQSTTAGEITARVNGATPTLTDLAGPAGTGNFGNYPLFIGRRNNTLFPLNGNIYQLIVCGKTLSASELASTEAYVNSKTGAY